MTGAAGNAVVEIQSTFIGDFKVGDNLVYNAGILCDLSDANESGGLNKLIVLQVGSILEAALGQIIYRAQNFNKEKVPNIAEKDRREIEGKQIDKFNNVIDVLQKYGVLNQLGEGIYDDLHRLRKFRNKVHIQDDIRDLPRDEIEVFTDQTCIWALELNVRVLRYLSEAFPRPQHTAAENLRPIVVPTA